MRVLVFPGRFSPVHFGHMGLLRAAIEEVGPDVVRVLVLNESGTKVPGAGAACRADMVNSAIEESLPTAMADMVDVVWGEGSPIGWGDSLAWSLAERARDGEHIFVLLGDSGASKAVKWPRRAWHSIVGGAVITRSVSGRVKGYIRRNVSSSGAQLTVLPFKPSPIVSSSVRQMLASPRKWANLPRLVPRKVLRTIDQQWLYFGRTI